MRVYICDKFTVDVSVLIKLSTLELLVVVCDQFLFLMLCKATLSLFSCLSGMKNIFPMKCIHCILSSD